MQQGGLWLDSPRQLSELWLATNIASLTPTTAELLVLQRKHQTFNTNARCSIHCTIIYIHQAGQWALLVTRCCTEHMAVHVSSGPRPAYYTILYYLMFTEDDN